MTASLLALDPATSLHENWRLHQDLFGWLISVPSLEEAAERLGISERFFRRARLFGADHIGALGVQGTELMLEAMPAGAKRVLDIASGLSGPGRTIATRLNAEVVGIDLLAEHCRGAYELSRLLGERPPAAVCGDAFHLPFKSGAFDAAFCVGSFSHLPDRGAVLAECRRTLRPKGSLVVLDEHGVVPRQPLRPEGFFHDPVYSYTTTQELQAQIGEAGLTLTSWQEPVEEAFRIVEERLLLLRSAWDIALSLMGRELARRVASILRELAEHYQRGTLIPVLFVAEKR